MSMGLFSGPHRELCVAALRKMLIAERSRELKKLRNTRDGLMIAIKTPGAVLAPNALGVGVET